jgi:hypothetical protein
MGSSSMVRAVVRVVAFAAIACLSLQAACPIVVPRRISAQAQTQGDTGCHESAPPAQNAPDSSHICCSGDHFPEALLSTIVTPAPLVLDGSYLGLNLALRSIALFFTDFPASFSPPHGPLALRI